MLAGGYGPCGCKESDTTVTKHHHQPKKLTKVRKVRSMECKWRIVWFVFCCFVLYVAAYQGFIY